MARKNTHNTKGKIIEAAWDLFYRQGYDDTTVEEIIAASGTSRGSFYHYFEGKDALLSSISLDLLARLYSSQLVTRGDKHLLDHNRIYYKLLRQIVLEGQQRGELREDLPVSEMVRVYALCERALIYDWCLSEGDYSLQQYGRTMMPLFFGSFRAQPK